MKIRIGEQVRIRRTNEVVTISDIELIRKKGAVHKYCQLKTPNGHPDLWLDSSELGEVVEVCTVLFETNDGIRQQLRLTVDHRHLGEIKALLTDKRKNDLSKYGLHVYLINRLMSEWTLKG